MRARQRQTERCWVEERKTVVESGPGRLAGGVIGPVAVEPGDTPFNALIVAGETAILDDRVVNAAYPAIVQHHVTAAVAPRDVVRLPGPERGFVDPAIARNPQGGIPERALLLLEL